MLPWKDARLKVYFPNNLVPESNPNETRCELVRMDNVIQNKKKIGFDDNKAMFNEPTMIEPIHES